MKLHRIRWWPTATIYHRASAACALAQSGARVSVDSINDTWRITWGKA